MKNNHKNGFTKTKQSGSQPASQPASQPESSLLEKFLQIPRNLRKNLLNTRARGISLVIAMILVTILVLFSANVTEVVVGANRNAVNILRSTQAYYAAESALEEALAANSKLKKDGKAIGAEQSGNGDVDVAKGIKYQWKISGTANMFPEKSVNNKFIIPLPWTGDAPWHGEGSMPSSGGCDPQKLPTKTADGHVELKGPNADLGLSDTQKLYFEEQYHPCNWSTIRTGEKVSIPLYSVDKDGLTVRNFSDFKLRLRTPCKDKKEMCENNERMQLNCFDRGISENRCSAKLSEVTNNKYRGEIMVLWQIDAKDSTGNAISLVPNDVLDTNKTYKKDDTQLYEGKINDRQKNMYSEVLSTKTDPFPVGSNGYPEGKQVSTDNSKIDIKDFITNNHDPVLSLTLVSDLVGCKDDPTLCNNDRDNPSKTGTYIGPMRIPYLEYQVIMENADSTYLPASNENVITVEGQSGQFVRTIQVRVPNNNTGLEYVIQQ